MRKAKKKTPGSPKKVVGKVFVMTYHHRHGDDISAYQSYQAAEASAVDIILDWLDEIDDVQVRLSVLELVSQGKFTEAREAWGRWQNDHGNEYITIEKESIMTSHVYPRRDLVKKGKAMLAQLQADQAEQQEYVEQRQVEEENDREVLVVDTTPQSPTDSQFGSGGTDDPAWDIPQPICKVENCGNIASAADGTCGNHPESEGVSFEETGEK